MYPEQTSASCPVCGGQVVPASFLARHLAKMHGGAESAVRHGLASRPSRSEIKGGHRPRTEDPVDSHPQGKPVGGKSYAGDHCQQCGVYLTNFCYSTTKTRHRVPRNGKICPGCFRSLHPNIQQHYFNRSYAVVDARQPNLGVLRMTMGSWSRQSRPLDLPINPSPQRIDYIRPLPRNSYLSIITRR